MSDSANSRILVVSSNLDHARDIVNRIKAFVNDTTDLPSADSIPWTIKNRYYTAQVHFHLVPFAQWIPQLAQDVPAVIYAWNRGEPYAEHIITLSNHLSRFEPEVSLAIALGTPSAHPSDPHEGADAFLADHSFEFIDAERVRRTPSSPNPHHASVPEPASRDGSEDEDAGVQGLPRVLDALSTIMWPSMVRSSDSGKRKSHMPMLFDVLPAEEPADDGDEHDAIAALLAADAADHGVPLTRARRMQSEMAALERWLIENEDLHEGELNEEETHEAGLVLHLPKASVGPDPWGIDDPTLPAHGVSAGFDDDFAAFVSVPALSITSAPMTSSPSVASPPPSAGGLHADIPQLLVPSHTGGSTHSIRSTASSFALDVDPEAGYEALDDSSSFAGDDEEPLATAIPRDPDLDLGLGGGNNVPFDLTDILSTLQTLRQDVAGIGDEDLRRAYSARFASDFVLRRMGDGEDSDLEQS